MLDPLHYALATPAPHSVESVLHQYLANLAAG